jgi:hypothetical protein
MARIRDADDSVLVLRSRIYSTQGRHELALAEAWKLFVAAPNYQNYRHLSELAATASEQEHKGWCDKAVALLQERFAAESRKFGTAHFQFTPTANALVAIRMDDGDIAGAWQIADTTPIASDLLQQLADASWSHHADCALRAYQRLLASQVDNGAKAAYLRATDLLKHLRTIMSSHAVAGFDELIAGLKLRYKAKRSFMAMLSENFS